MKIFVAGTDTNVGKTVFAAALAGALDASYWKPVQAGDLELTDSDRVRSLSGLPAEKIVPEAYRLGSACSPHRSAELDGVRIACDGILPPDTDPLVIEGAGGLLVPLTRDFLFADLAARWQLPTILVARTGLGTINHSLLSIHALWFWKIPILGIAFVGDEARDSEETICAASGVKCLGRLPLVEPLDQMSLSLAFGENFSLDDFR